MPDLRAGELQRRGAEAFEVDEGLRGHGPELPAPNQGLEAPTEERHMLDLHGKDTPGVNLCSPYDSRHSLDPRLGSCLSP